MPEFCSDAKQTRSSEVYRQVICIFRSRGRPKELNYRRLTPSSQANSAADRPVRPLSARRPCSFAARGNAAEESLRFVCFRANQSLTIKKLMSTTIIVAAAAIRHRRRVPPICRAINQTSPSTCNCSTTPAWSHAEKRGHQNFYAICDPMIFRLCDRVCQSVAEKSQEDIKELQRSGWDRRRHAP